MGSTCTTRDHRESLQGKPTGQGYSLDQCHQSRKGALCLAGAQQEIRLKGTGGQAGLTGCATAPGLDAAGSGDLQQNTDRQQERMVLGGQN